MFNVLDRCCRLNNGDEIRGDLGVRVKNSTENTYSIFLGCIFIKYRYEAGSLLVILFLLLLNSAIVLCMWRNITAVCNRLLRLLLLRIA